jgi:hypothetical protein
MVLETIGTVIAGVRQLSLGLEASREVRKAIESASSTNSKVDKVDSVANIYDTVKQKSNDRSVLGMTERFTSRQDETDKYPVLSPPVTALMDLYGSNALSSVVYVMYDKPGMGKTTAGIALLKSFYSFPTSGKELKGLMITGESMEEDYVMKVCGQLEIGRVKGWLHALLLGMDEAVGTFPSILILDAFNSMIPSNLDFIKALYHEMNASQAKKNIIVVVITSEEEVAMKLCDLNGGLRVQPLPGYFEGDRKTPTWKHQAWPHNLLVESVRYEYPGFLQEDQCTFISDDMSPCEASLCAASAIRAKRETIELPGSPKKKAKSSS